MFTQSKQTFDLNTKAASQVVKGSGKRNIVNTSHNDIMDNHCEVARIVGT